MSENDQRRKWSPAEKLRIVLAGMQPGVEVSDLCRREGLNSVQFHAWKRQLLGSAERVFEDHRGQPALAMSEAEQVTAAYDRIAEAWWHDRGAARTDFRERGLVDRLIAPLPPHARVLDVGCGCGVPVAAYLAARGLRVTGLDGSGRMLDLARRAVPEAAFLHGDMRTTEVSGLFDAVVAWDSVFHIPRSDHAAVFRRFRSWLQPGGRLLVSLGGTGEDAFTSVMHGETFFYSGHEPSEAFQVLSAAGFQVEHWEVDDPSSRGHIAVLAVRVST